MILAYLPEQAGRLSVCTTRAPLSHQAAETAGGLDRRFHNQLAEFHDTPCLEPLGYLTPRGLTQVTHRMGGAA